ncbi:MAG: M23 family metallopeptidase [Bacteroidales bacterium]|nr:M23 family metallopeptidase [Bacteroidales bacterium]
MARNFYFFNPDTMSFEQAKLSVWTIVKRIIWLVTTAIAFAIFVLWIAFYLFDSPKEKMLQKENNELKEQLRAINKNLEVMDVVLEDIQDRDDQVYRAIFEAEPIPLETRNPWFNLTTRYDSIPQSETVKLLKTIDLKTKGLFIKLKEERESLDSLLLLAENKNDMLAAIPAIRPIKNMYNVTSGFGLRIHPILKTYRKHTGVDITAPRGTPIYATADGTVSRQQAAMGYGTNVIIDHGFSYQTLYGHLSKKIVKPGQKVKRGELIGYVGNTGLSMGPHLHYEVWKNGIPVNPVQFFTSDITPEEYNAILESSKKVNQALS